MLSGFREKFISRKIYFLCLGACIIFIASYCVLAALGISITEISPFECTLYSIIGLYCPGCGGTRAVEYLMKGKIIHSFFYHPAVPYTAGVLVYYVCSHSLDILTNGRINGMLFRPIYFYIMIAIILLQWIVKNTLILTIGVYLLG